MRDQEELAAIELQIREFGQTPRRLFVLPHVPRLVGQSKVNNDAVGEEEIRTVGATTEGLSRMDSTSSWSQTSLSKDVEENDWVHVDLPQESAEEERLLAPQVTKQTFSIDLRHRQKVHRE